MKLKKVILGFFLLVVLVQSCDQSSKNSDANLDSLEIDLIRCYFLAYHQTRTGYYIMNHVNPGLDSIHLDALENQLITLWASRDSIQPEFEVVVGDLLLVDYCDSIMCKLSLIDKGKVVGEGWLPKKAVASLKNPWLKLEMSTFYRLQDDLIEKYSKDFRQKYHLSEREFDSLLDVTASKIADRGRLIRNDMY